jgi:hypothetical protein
MKLQFMMEMDRKLREHLGDLDVRSMRDKRSKRGGYRDDSSYDSEVESRRRGKGRRRDETPPKKDKRGA